MSGPAPTITYILPRSDQQKKKIQVPREQTNKIWGSINKMIRVIVVLWSYG